MQKGFIVLLVLMGGGSYQPVFHTDEELMFFDTEKAAQEEIDDCISGVAQAVKDGDMDHEEDPEGYVICPAVLDGDTITCTKDGRNYTMLRTEDDWTEV